MKISRTRTCFKWSMLACCPGHSSTLTRPLWVRILKGLAPREDLVLNEDGEIAWAIRKNCPLLRHELDDFVTAHGKFADDLVSETSMLGTSSEMRWRHPKL